MRKVIAQEFISLDGLAADQEGSTRFFDAMVDKAIDEDILQFIHTIDTILLGAETYRMFIEYWPEATTDTELVADQLNETPKIVFSNTLDQAPWGRWKPATVVKSEAAEAVSQLKQQPGKDIVLWGSISLAQSLMKKGLVDEYQLRVCPTVLGKGRPLFSRDVSLLNLKLLDAKTYDNGVIFLKYDLSN